MKFLLIITSILLFSMSSFPQKENIVVKYTHISSLGKPGVNIDAFNGGLYISPNTVLYVAKIDSLEGGNKTIQEVYKDEKGKMHGIRVFSSEAGVYNLYNRKTDSLYSNAVFNKNFIYKEKRPTINWKLIDQEKEIEGVKVKKATAEFRGRNYIAWYAPEIAVPFGPWKLHGLPGLIIEAYDTNKEISFLFKSLKIPYKKPINFPTYKRAWLSFQDYLTERETHIERNLKYNRTIGQEFSAESSEDEKSNIIERSFIERF